MQVTHSRGALQRSEPLTDRGIAQSRQARASSCISGGFREPGDPLAALPEALRQPARAVLEEAALSEESLERCAHLASRIVQAVRCEGAERLDVTVHVTRQRVLQGAEEGPCEEGRGLAILDMRLYPPDAGEGGETCGAAPRSRTSMPWSAVSLRFLRPCTRRRRRCAGSPPCPVRTGTLTVVLPPGAAPRGPSSTRCAAIPLEGDVVARRRLLPLPAPAGQARGAGAPDAPADDPTERGALCACLRLGRRRAAGAGGAAAPRVGSSHEPLLDRRSAQCPGRAPNGHGRRVDFRHAALPNGATPRRSLMRDPGRVPARAHRQTACTSSTSPRATWTS